VTNRILAPIAAAAYKSGHSEWYGATEIDAETGERVWRFDALDAGLAIPEIS